MIQIKHVSFDLWMTLIKSNPTFKTERVKYFFEHYNSKNKSIAEIASIIRNIDLMCNQMNEIKGVSISSEEMYLMVLYQINENLENYNLTILNKIYAEINELFELYSPTVYDAYTIETLEHLKTKNISMSLLSNTAFLKGISLMSILKKLHLNDFFDFHFFSDEFNLSKPNPLFFKQTFEQLNNKLSLLKTEIIHIGDNYKADFLGAQNFGYNPILINSNDKSILELKKL